mgnify:CR=1 FL=1
MSSLLLCIPFGALLMCVAVLPLVKEEWWEKNRPVVVAVLSLAFVVPFAFVNGAEGLHHLYCAFVWIVLCVRQHHFGRRSCGFSKSELHASFLWCIAFKLHRHHRSFHAFDSPCNQNEFLEKKEIPCYDFLHFPHQQHGWLSYTDWRSATAYGIHERRAFCLESQTFPYTSF